MSSNSVVYDRLIKINGDEPESKDGKATLLLPSYYNEKKILTISNKDATSPIKINLRGTTVQLDAVHLKYISLITLTVQNAALNLTMRAARTQKEQFSAAVAVTISEVIKFFTCLAIIIYQENSFKCGLNVFKISVIYNYIDTLKVAVPSLVYYIQNNLLYIGSTHLDAATAQVTYQLKIMTTAIFSVVMLNRKLSKVQWVSLVILFLGVATIETLIIKKPGNIEGNETESKESKEKPVLGFIAILIACCLSGFAGVYFEKILKKTDHVSLWVRNVQLAMASIPFGLIQLLLVHDASTSKGYFHGFTPLTWFCILLQVQGGLLVAMVVKYSNNISKGFATSMAIVISTLASMYLFDFDLQVQFVLGATMVIGSVMMYSK